jgi:hypothetical protein
VKYPLIDSWPSILAGLVLGCLKVEFKGLRAGLVFFLQAGQVAPADTEKDRCGQEM